MTVNLMSEYPKLMVPAFDRRQGIKYWIKIKLIKIFISLFFSIERFLNY